MNRSIAGGLRTGLETKSDEIALVSAEREHTWSELDRERAAGREIARKPAFMKD
jgi:hypothetical protein